MKKSLLILSLFIYCAIGYSQSFELTVDGSSTIVNGTEVVIYANTTQYDVEADIKAKNLGAQRDIKVRKREMFYGVNTQDNAICWGGCTLPVAYNTVPVQESDIINLEQDSALVFNGHVYPNGNAGDVKFRYIWFDVNNPTDTAFVDVLFQVTASSTSIDELNKDISLNVFPNPSSNGLLNVKLNSTPNNNQTVVITDMLGKRVYRENISTNTLSISTNEFNQGIYFVSLREAGEILFTEKVIITK